jgi:hypothetical protein
LSESALLFMLGFECLEHEMCGRQRLDEVFVSWGDTVLNETSQSTVVASPDEIGFRSGGCIWAWKRAIEPRFETLLQDDEAKFPAPFTPVGFPEIKD